MCKSVGRIPDLCRDNHYEIGRPARRHWAMRCCPKCSRRWNSKAPWCCAVVIIEKRSSLDYGHAHLLAGSVIGVLGIHDDQGTRQWTAEEIALVEAVTERMARRRKLRLFDEAQRRAAASS